MHQGMAFTKLASMLWETVLGMHAADCCVRIVLQL